MRRRCRLWWSRSRFLWKIRASVSPVSMIDIVMAVSGKTTSVLKWALCDVSPAQIHSFVANFPLSPRLCELFRNLAQGELSESSRVQIVVRNKWGVSYLISMARRRSGENYQPCLFICYSEGKTITCFKWHNWTLLWRAALQSLSRKDYVTNQTNAYRGHLYVVQKYDRGEGLQSSALGINSWRRLWKETYEVMEIQNQGSACHKTKDDRAFLEWFQTNIRIIVSVMINN